MFPYSYHSQCYLTTRLCTHPTHLRQQDITGELTFTQTVSVIHDHSVNSEITVYEWVQQEVDERVDTAGSNSINLTVNTFH